MFPESFLSNFCPCGGACRPAGEGHCSQRTPLPPVFGWLLQVKSQSRECQERMVPSRSWNRNKLINVVTYLFGMLRFWLISSTANHTQIVRNCRTGKVFSSHISPKETFRLLLNTSKDFWAPENVPIWKRVNRYQHADVSCAAY